MQPQLIHCGASSFGGSAASTALHMNGAARPIQFITRIAWLPTPWNLRNARPRPNVRLISGHRFDPAGPSERPCITGSTSFKLQARRQPYIAKRRTAPRVGSAPVRLHSQRLVKLTPRDRNSIQRILSHPAPTRASRPQAARVQS